MSFQIQQQIKQNAQQIRTYVSDLYDWQQQMQLKQKAKIRVLKQQRAKEVQISKQLQKQIQEKKKKPEQQENKAQKQSKQVKKDLFRDVNTVKDYYNAWDKYDIDNELKRLQQQETRPYRPYNPYQSSLNYIRAKPKAKVNINVKGQRSAIIDPTELKDKGNLHYKVSQYQKAINAYSQCLQKLQQQQSTQKNDKLKCVVLSNRAMTYMKINQRAKALKDCNQSLHYDQNYLKSYLRRADCHRKLGNYRQSLQDFKKVKELDPADKQVDAEINKIQKYIQKLYKQARESLIVQNPMKVIPDSYRIQIQEVKEFQETLKNQDKQKKVNYLEEL